MTWWFPPLSKAPFSGPSAVCTSVVKSLKRGGFPARTVTDVSDQLRFGSALFMPIIAALEKNSWSFTDLARSGDLALAGQAGREASELVLPGRNRWRAALITHPWTLRVILMVAARVAPFHLEEMLRHHFTKVGDQTRAMLKAYIALAEHRETSSQSLEKLLMALSTP